MTVNGKAEGALGSLVTLTDPTTTITIVVDNGAGSGSAGWTLEDDALSGGSSTYTVTLTAGPPAPPPTPPAPTPPAPPGPPGAGPLLKTLTLLGGIKAVQLTPTFSPSVTSYTGVVAAAVKAVGVKTTVDGTSDTVTVNGKAEGALGSLVTLTDPTTTITIVVAAAPGAVGGAASTTYTVTLTAGSGESARLRNAKHSSDTHTTVCCAGPPPTPPGPPPTPLPPIPVPPPSPPTTTWSCTGHYPVVGTCVQDPTPRAGE